MNGYPDSWCRPPIFSDRRATISLMTAGDRMRTPLSRWEKTMLRVAYGWEDSSPRRNFIGARLRTLSGVLLIAALVAVVALAIAGQIPFEMYIRPLGITIP